MGETAMKQEATRRERGARPGTREKTYVGLIDMKAAYDKVNRETLIKMMEGTSIKKEVISAVAKLLDATSFSIPQAQAQNFTGTSKHYKVIRTDLGVQQGSVIAPSLFSIYLATLLEELKKTTSC